ncbi:MAG: DEAD/DEAH box helicase [Burkholderiales bacterium]|nr:MAG: DEAD/DEAH box helicase [Burkholderiales bacterium]
MQLRDYQVDAIEGLWAWLEQHEDGNPIMDCSVGSGKSVMIAAVCQRADYEYPGTRVLVIVPQKELLQQNAEKLMKVWPGVDLGIVSASFGRKVVGRQITYATIGSVYKIAHLLGRIDIVMADECHQIQTKEQGMWRNFLKDLHRYNPHCRVFGWTGTPFRGNGVWLTAGAEPLFNAIAAGVPMKRLVDEGFLCPLVTADVATRIGTEGVAVDTTTGDFKVNELAEASDKPELIEAACRELIARATAQGRKRWIVFGVTIEHATHIRDCLRWLGISAEVIHGDTKKLPSKERDQIVQRYRAGQFTCLVNVAVATTGFDVPEIDCIALMRATKSPVLYVQIAGRGMRLIGQHISESTRNGKPDCLWLDFTETTLAMGPVDEIKGRVPMPGRGGPPPFKLCPNCGSQNATARLKCTSCGHDFPPPERINHDATVKDAPVMSGQKPKYARHDLTACEYYRHSKEGSPDCMRVLYKSGLQVVATEYVHFDRRGPMRLQAEGWWERRVKDPNGWLPSSTADAVVLAQQGALRTPIAATMTKGKYPEIIDVEFKE